MSPLVPRGQVTALTCASAAGQSWGEQAAAAHHLKEHRRVLRVQHADEPGPHQEGETT